MKLCRFGEIGSEKPAVLVPSGSIEQRLDVSAFCTDFNEEFFDKDGVARLTEWLLLNGASAPSVLKRLA